MSDCEKSNVRFVAIRSVRPINLPCRPFQSTPFILRNFGKNQAKYDAMAKKRREWGQKGSVAEVSIAKQT